MSEELKVYSNLKIDHLGPWTEEEIRNFGACPQCKKALSQTYANDLVVYKCYPCSKHFILGVN